MSNRAASWAVSDDQICLKGVTPNVFIGGPVSNPPGFPLTACGKDGLEIGNLRNSVSCGGSTQRN